MSFLKKGLCFDSDFYADQQENRQQQMVITKVTKEFIEEDKRRKRSEALAERRRCLAFGIEAGTDDVENPNSPDIDDEDDNDEDCAYSNVCSEFHHFNSNYFTRGKDNSGVSLSTSTNVGTQTETDLPTDVSL